MGGSGGGGSGKIGYPAYIETFHSHFIDNATVDALDNSVVDLMNAAWGNSPWTLLSAYDPDADITAWEAAITAFAAILAGITDTTDWAALHTQAEATVDDFTDVGGITEAVIVADVAALANQLDDEILTKVLPRFRRGMQDINAVVSSSFALGQAVIEGFRDRDVAKHNSAIRLSAAAKNADVDLKNVELHNQVKQLRLGAVDQMLRLMLQRISWQDGYMRTVIEGKRIKIVAKKEQADIDAQIDERDASWDLSVIQYGNNTLAAPGGGVVKPREPTQAQSAIGGAMSGAAAGAMVGSAVPGIGTGVGALVGGLIGAASGFS